jgi:hypothetical protein
MNQVTVLLRLVVMRRTEMPEDAPVSHRSLVETSKNMRSAVFTKTLLSRSVLLLAEVFLWEAQVWTEQVRLPSVGR